ncbi:MAG TPA: hypothetical protein VG265_13240 [Gaiellaceae bacterium]|jgi:hypothetical protein|nr:hypothetical protein [Gaiellaceae bacterium]
MGRLISLLVAGAVGLAFTAGAFAAKPDAHDRSLSTALAAKVTVFANLVAQDDTNALIKGELKSCAPFESKDPSTAFSATIALIPALFVRLVDDYKPQLTALEQTLRSMHPDSGAFAKWTAAYDQNLKLILRFDNHGAKIDLCRATMVLLDKKSTGSDFRRVLGIDPALIAAIFKSKSSNTVTDLDPQMRTFFVQAGLSAKIAKKLTS